MASQNESLKRRLVANQESGSANNGISANNIRSIKPDPGSAAGNNSSSIFNALKNGGSNQNGASRLGNQKDNNSVFSYLGNLRNNTDVLSGEQLTEKKITGVPNYNGFYENRTWEPVGPAMTYNGFPAETPATANQDAPINWPLAGRDRNSIVSSPASSQNIHGYSSGLSAYGAEPAGSFNDGLGIEPTGSFNGDLGIEPSGGFNGDFGFGDSGIMQGLGLGAYGAEPAGISQFSQYRPEGGIGDPFSDVVRDPLKIDSDQKWWQNLLFGRDITWEIGKDGKYRPSDFGSMGLLGPLGLLFQDNRKAMADMGWDAVFNDKMPDSYYQTKAGQLAKEDYTNREASAKKHELELYKDILDSMSEDDPDRAAIEEHVASLQAQLDEIESNWYSLRQDTMKGTPKLQNYQPELAKDETNPLVPGTAMAVVGDDGQIQIVDSKTGEPIAMTAEEFFGGQGYEDLGYGQRGHIGENGEWITNDQAYYNRRLQEAFDKWSSEFGGKYRSLQEMMLKGTPEEFLQMYKYDPELFATAMVDTWGGDYDWLTYDALMQDGEMSLDILSKLIGERRGANSIDTLLQALRTGGVEGQAAFDLLSGPGGAFTDDLAMFLSDLGLGWSSQFDNSGDISSLLSTMSNEDYQAARAEADARNLWMLLASGGLGDEFDNQFLSDWFSTYYGMDTGNPLEGYTFDGLNPYLTGSEGDYRVTNAPTYGGLSFGYYNNPWTLGGSGDYSYVDSLPMAYLYDLLDSVGVYGPTSQEQ